MSRLQQFIENELEKRKADYLSSPAYIIEHFNIEQQNIQAYNGRQLLEMLQNADDACEHTSRKKVFIKLSGNVLTIANNGEPFNEPGFRSIIYSNISPKTKQQNKIGQKGLGFRSILSWADEIIINSGGIRLGFSRLFAEAFLEDLIKESEDLSSFLEEMANSTSPIAILRIPKLLDGLDDNANKFDTTITITLKQDVLEDVQSQITSLINKETLIFLNNIEVIHIDSPERRITYKKKYADRSKNRVKVSSRDRLNGINESKTWYVKRREGKHKKKNFELAIAWNDELDETENVLFSYFKTKVRFPFPALLHGTFELTQDRNQLTNDTEQHNNFLTSELAELLIETALEIATKSSEANYFPLRLLNIDFDKIDNVLQEFKFKEHLIDKIKYNPVFPSVNNHYIRYDNRPVFYENYVADMLYGDDVDNLMPTCDDKSLVKFINSFTLYHFTLEKFVSIIARRVPEIEIEQLAKLFFHLLDYEPYRKTLKSGEFELSDLDKVLPDSDNNLICWDSNVFIPPQDNREFRVSKALNIQFLNQGFINALAQEMGTDSIDVLLDRLQPFEIKKYSFSEISQTLIDYYASRTILQREEVIELHTTLFPLFRDETKPEVLPDNIDAPVIALNKRIKTARQVYFGEYYGNALTEQVYKYDKSKLLASPYEHEIVNQDENLLKKYFKWLGVAEMPRKVFINGGEAFAEYVFKRYDYRNSVGNHRFTNYTSFKKAWNRYGEIKVQAVDDLDKILAKNNCETIIAWLCTDDSIYKLMESDTEPTESFIEAHFGSDWYNRSITSSRIKNYLRWRLSNAVWINTKSGIKQAPIFCTTSATISEEFSPLIEKPNIDYGAPVFRRNNISVSKVEYLLSIVGVNKTISSFETNILYSILNKLPQIDVEGKKAKTLYRELAVNYEEKNLDTTDEEYKKFVAQGKVFCRKQGKADYKDVNSVFYVNDRRYGQSIINQYNIIEIERRRSQEKIEKVFRVKPLKGLKLTLAKAPELHLLNGKFEQELESFKPYVYVFRQGHDSSGKERNLIKDVRFKLVTELIVLLEKEDEEYPPFNLSYYEYLYLPRNRTIYIRTPEYLDDDKKLKDDISFCSTIAECFSALIDVEAQRQQIRELFSRSVSGRDDIIRDELDDYNLEKLAMAGEKLGIVSDPKIQFWFSFVKCFPAIRFKKHIETDETLLRELKNSFPELAAIIASAFESIDYEDYNEESSLRLIIELLAKSEISLQKFNRYVYPSVYVTEVYELDFKRIKEDKKSQFKQAIFSRLVSSEDDKNDFFRILAEYENLRGRFQNEIGYDVELDLEKQLKEKFNIELEKEYEREADCEKIYFSNKSVLESKLREIHISEDLLKQFFSERPELEYLLYFSEEIEKLLGLLLDWLKDTKGNPQSPLGPRSKKLSLGQLSFFYDNFEDLYVQLDSNEIIKSTLSKIKIEKVRSPGFNKVKRPLKGKFTRPKKPKEDLGFLGECLVYKHLFNTIRDKQSIKWVSENAKLAGVNPDGKDGLGYDIVYRPNDAKYPRYVEVKLIGKENSFHISSNEIIQGEKLRKHYEMFLVRNIIEPGNIVIEVIQSPFDYKGQETFTDNRLFTVINDTFILKFQKM